MTSISQPGFRQLTSAIICSVLLCVCMPGCVNKATINSYVDPTFQPGQVSKLAVFPIRNARLAPSESQEINRKISQGIVSSSPQVVLISPSESIEVLNQKGLADRWARFLETYTTSGVPNASELRVIGEALGVDAIIQGEVVNVIQQDGAFGKNVGKTRVTVRLSMLDVKAGKLLWEASSDGIRENAATIGEAPPIIEAINLAVNKLVGSLPPI